MIQDIQAENNEAEVRRTILECLSLENPISFYLYAGAGSGKTRSLANCLQDCLEHYGEALKARAQRVSVITYTNAACDEIQRRVEFNPLIKVSTIHSFVWDLISPFSSDIRTWLQERLNADIEKLRLEIAGQREGTKIAATRVRDLERKQKRLTNLSNVKRFVYSPAGDIRSRDSLDHTEVLQMGAQFILEKPLMQKILVSGSPILLIDESQDTNKHVMNALLDVQAKHGDKFCLGLFGDAMQRIYFDGRDDLITALPNNWKKPVKKTNYRSPKRIVSLINQIRKWVDQHEQDPRDDAPEGVVRFFVAPSSEQVDRKSTELKAVQRMAETTGDQIWLDGSGRKTLTLEHHMAAKRLGFDSFFLPLYKVNRIKTPLLDGTLPELRFFTGDLLSLFQAIKAENKFALAALLRERSPLLEKRNLRAAGAQQSENLKKALEAVSQLTNVWARDSDPSLYEIMRVVADSGLLEVPERFLPFCSDDGLQVQLALDDGDAGSAELLAWQEALASPFSQIRSYSDYVNDLAPFGTHQGVKGLEFPRVLVVLDDFEAGAQFFSYEKLFGIKPKTKADLDNEAEGKDTSILRTTRLFYVTCSRAEDSLAIVAYTEDPTALRKQVVSLGLFAPDEVEPIE